MNVNQRARSGDIIRIFFSIFFKIKVCCVFSLESPHRGDSNEYTQYTISKYEKAITLKYPVSAVMGIFSKGPRNKFETAVVHEHSVFQPLKVYCTVNRIYHRSPMQTNMSQPEGKRIRPVTRFTERG